MSARLAIMTCITNGGGVGPGHTAVIVGDTVYSFENAGDWFSVRTESSGWITMDAQEYIDKNAARPVVLQDINEQVNRSKVLRYIFGSMETDMDYLSSGVCSSLVCSAIEAGYTGSFNPPGVDTPYKTFHLANKKGIVRGTSVTWADRDTISSGNRSRIQEKVKSDYPSLVAMI